MKKNNLERALQLLQRSIELKKDIRLAYIDAGTILARQKRYHEAASALQQAVALDPGEPETHYQLGRVYQAMNKPEQAQEEYAKVRQLHKKSVDEDLARKMSDEPPTPSFPAQ
jgi:Flp pilus assembly protein TadD